ncbi:MAG: alanine racemase [Actinomycetota bacterium]
MTGPEALIDLGAYRRNIDLVRLRVAPAQLMAVVKADAYGHGLLPMARAAVSAGVLWIGALDVATALQLRAGDGGGGISDDIAIFAWMLGPTEDYAGAVAGGIDLGVSTIEQLDRAADATTATRPRVHLKIDTGLHRNGASAEHWPSLVARALELHDRLDLVGAWTHIAEASESEDSEAISRFHEAIAVAEALGAAFAVRHLAASAAAFVRADARFDLVRIGAFSYGIAPGGGVTPFSLGLEPVMTLRAPVVAVHSGIAELGIGFGDGIPGSAAGVMAVGIGGNRYPINGIGLEHLTIVVGDAPIRPGDEAVLFGAGRSGEATLQEWGDALGTIGEEIVTRIGPRIPRTYRRE